MRPLADARTIVQEATRLLGEHLAVDQVTYAELGQDGSASIWPAYVAETRGFADRLDIGDLDAEATRAIRAGRTVVVTDVREHADLTGRQKAMYETSRSRARIAVPLSKEGVLVGVLSVHQPDPRAWRPEEIALVEETADRIWEALERVRAEQALAANRAELERQARLYDTVLANVGHLIFVWGLDKRFVFANRALEQLWGLPPGEYLGKTTSDLGYSPELAALLDRQIDEVIATRAPVSDEVPYTNPSGDFGYYEYTFTPVLGADGRVELVAGVARDTTERRRAQEDLRASEARLRQAIEIETVGVVFFTFDGPLTHVNDAFLRMSGFTRDEVARGLAHWERITPPEWMERSRQALAEVMAEGRSTPFEKEYLRRDGTRWWALSTTARISDTEGVQFVIDITAHKRAEAERDRLAAIVESTRDAVIGIDLDGVILGWNPAAVRLLGYAAAEAVGQSLEIFVPPHLRAEIAATVDRVRRGEDVPPFETLRRRKDGSLVQVEIQPSPVRDAAGRVSGVAAIVRDVTERKLLQQAQEDFIAMVSHDLRSPITALSGRAQLMKRRQQYDDRGIDAILEQARRISRLVSDLQTLVSMEAGGIELIREEVDLAALARDAAQRLQETVSSHVVRIEAPSDGVIGSWDPDRIGQVLDNLLGNAVKYAPDSREIDVRIERLGLVATVSVTDHGPGIAASRLPHLFDRFYRAGRDRSSPGLGLGLYIARMLVEAHDGRIEARSTPGAGSVFTFTLPIDG
jgi:PAS domain S-box-containing protein